MKSSPGFTHAMIGMSGCQRLWIASFLYGDCERSISISVFAITTSFYLLWPFARFLLGRALVLAGVSGMLAARRGTFDRWPRNRVKSDREELGDGGLVDAVAGIAVDDPSVLHHQDAVGDFENEAQHLLTHHDAQIAHFADLLEELGDLLDDRRLDAFGRLVEQEDFRIAGKRARDRELLLLAARQVAAAAFLELPQHRE